MPLGDSITEGTAGSTLNWGYRAELQTSLNNSNYDFVGPHQDGDTLTLDRDHAGVGGERTDEVESRTLSNLTNYMSNVDGVNSCVVLHVGTNDIDQGIDLDVAVANVEDIIDIIDSYNSNIRVFVCQIIPIANDETDEASVVSFNDKLEIMLDSYSKNNLYMIDAHTPFVETTDWETEIMADNWHPDDDGYILLGDTIAASVNNNTNQLTPVARVDVVPLQRIEYGATFNFGMIAFHKEGIEKVDFAISGQGYSGGTKTATEMTLNNRTGVWEYWVPISSSEFTSNGPITVTATATGEDAGTRTEPATTLIVEATEAYSHYEAWVDIDDGDDSTGTVGSSSLPYKTIPAAVSAAQTANNGSSDGNIIYLEEGTYDLGDASVSTTSEWLTITKSASASKESVIINDPGTVSNTNYIHAKDITIQSQSPGLSTRIFISDYPVHFWSDGLRVIGSGRWDVYSNPVMYSGYSDDEFFSTDSYVYNVNYAFRRVGIVRGAEIDTVGDDAFENGYFVVNTTLNNLHNGTTGAHADAFQLHTAGAIVAQENIIVYGYKITNAGYQGVFLGLDGEVPPNDVFKNCAFVNIFIDIREPFDLNESGDVSAAPASFYNGKFDHLIFWNNTIPYMEFSSDNNWENSSFRGNVVWAFLDNSDLSMAAPNNTVNNDFLDNHYMTVYEVTPTCSQIPSVYTDKGWPCPHWYAKAPDSAVSGSHTTGEGVLNMDTSSEEYGQPKSSSTDLLEAFTSLVPADINNNPRGSNSSIGAFEYGSGVGKHTCTGATISGGTFQ